METGAVVQTRFDDFPVNHQSEPSIDDQQLGWAANVLPEDRTQRPARPNGAWLYDGTTTDTARAPAVCLRLTVQGDFFRAFH